MVNGGMFMKKVVSKKVRIVNLRGNKGKVRVIKLVKAS